MTCVTCARQEKSDPQVKSGWRAVAVDGTPYYICPGCMPPDKATAEQFKAAYLNVFGAIKKQRGDKRARHVAGILCK